MISAKDSIIEEFILQNWQEEQLERMIEQSIFDEEKRSELFFELSNISNEDLYNDFYFRLSQNQRDRISSGDPYGQKDISEHLKKLK